MNVRWLIWILVLLLVSCGFSDPLTPPAVEIDPSATEPVPVATEEVKEVLPSPTVIMPSLTPEMTLPPAPTQTQESISAPAAIIAKITGGPNSYIVVGGSQAGTWLSGSEAAQDLDLTSTYQIYTPFDFQTSAAGQDLFHEQICDQYYLTLDPTPASETAVGIGGEWPVLPRVPVEIPIDTEVYLRAITGWQIEQAPSMPIPVIDKIWKIDVEGNGTDEVFINGTRYAEPTGHNVEPRDYSVVLMRTVSGSDVVTIELIGDYYKEEAENQFPLTYNLEFIGDLNGDGRMEVVVGISRWEGSGVMVFEINGVEVQLVLSVMCSL